MNELYFRKCEMVNGREEESITTRIRAPEGLLAQDDNFIVTAQVGQRCVKPHIASV